MTNTQDTFEANDSTVIINGRTYTHRTRDGQYARIICDDRFVNVSNYPVVALVLDKSEEQIERYTEDLKYSTAGIYADWNLIKGAKPSLPKTDWTKVAIDTPIWVSENASTNWYQRNFACVLSDGRIGVFLFKGTSETSKSILLWDKATLTNPNT
jgi:hypothetical protein